MADEFYYHNTPAVKFPYVECNLEQLQSLTRNAQDILNVLEHTKKSVAALNLFQTRLYQNRAVRCTKQSVKATATARYAPENNSFDLRIVPINVFLDLVTYLPLLDLKALSSNADALWRVTQLFYLRPLSHQWGTYCTYLTSCNKEWAKLFFDDVQQYFQAVGQRSDLGLERTLGAQSMSDQVNLRSPDLSISEPRSSNPLAANWRPSSLSSGPQTVASTAEAALNPHQPQPQSSPGPNSTSPGSSQPPISNLLDFHLRALRAKEKAWGVDHPTTLDTAAALGRLYASQSRAVEADASPGRALSNPN